MTNVGAIEKMVQEVEGNYFKRIEDIAIFAFEKHILPFLKKYDLEFISGNGSFFIGYTESTPKWFVRKYRINGYYDPQIDIDKLPKRILTILEAEGTYNNNLGSLMPCYNLTKFTF